MTDKNNYELFKEVKLPLKKKSQYNYADWASVWKKVLEVDPNAIYDVCESEKGKPVIQVGKGCMVQVRMKINGVVKSEWMPVLNNYHKQITVDNITVFDINTTIKRCLVKCAALFGLGLQVFIDGNNPEDEAKE